MDELLFKSAFFDSMAVPIGLTPCEISQGSLCMMDLATGNPLPIDDLDWFLSPSSTESRTCVPVSLSRQFGFSLTFFNLFPEFDTASCVGRFVGKDLIFLTDGTNGSGGYFLPAAFKGKGVIVTTGGYVGEPMSMGMARGGATFPGSRWASMVDAMEFLADGQLIFDEGFLQFDRSVDSNMEMWGRIAKTG